MGHRGHRLPRRRPHERLYVFGPPWRPPFGPAAEHGGHGGGRGRRADVRDAILVLLTERPMHGYEMIQEIERRSHGTWRPSPGSVYPTLQVLEDEGLIAAEAAEGGRRRLHLTEGGRAAQSGEDQARPPWERFSEEYGRSVLDTRAATHAVMQAIGEVMRIGTDRQRQRANEVLDQARRQLHQILADRD